ncbi:hypothetical protein [Jeotgalibaca porci]|uniref:hypothetical protein n=1 Tax=Jeotgalibaca porci TaxID=1868793 RepID=UPI0035A001B7
MADEMIRSAGRSSNGLAKPIRVDNDGKILEGVGRQVVVTRTDTFAPTEEHVLIDTDNHTLIEEIDWLARHETNAEIYLEIKGASGGFIDANGTGITMWLTPLQLLNNKSLLFDIVQYDTTAVPDPKFRFHLKRPIQCPLGYRIVLRNTSTDKSFRNSCQVRGRVFDVKS